MLTEQERAVLAGVVVRGSVCDTPAVEYIDAVINPALPRQDASPPMIVDVLLDLARARLDLAAMTERKDAAVKAAEWRDEYIQSIAHDESNWYLVEADRLLALALGEAT
jgi:hypothetical protein